MSQAGPTPDPNLTCRDCGASNDRDASECWLCQCRDWRRPPRFGTSAKPAASWISDDGLKWTRPLMVVTLGLVGTGSAIIAPGLVLLLVPVVLPAWYGAEWIAQRRRDRGLQTSTTKKVAWIVALTILLPILGFASLCIAVYLLCLVSGLVSGFPSNH